MIATLARLYRGDDLNGYKFDESQFPQLTEAQLANLKSSIKNRKYTDITGLCKVATVKEVEAKEWSLNAGRYVGVTEKDFDNIDFPARLGRIEQ